MPFYGAVPAPFLGGDRGAVDAGGLSGRPGGVRGGALGRPGVPVGALILAPPALHRRGDGGEAQSRSRTHRRHYLHFHDPISSLSVLPLRLYDESSSPKGYIFCFPSVRRQMLPASSIPKRAILPAFCPLEIRRRFLPRLPLFLGAACGLSFSFLTSGQ